MQRAPVWPSLSAPALVAFSLLLALSSLLLLPVHGGIPPSGNTLTHIFPNCSAPPLLHTPICDPSLPYLTRAHSLVSLMNLTEKTSRLQNAAPGIPRLGLPPYEWWSEALHGVGGSPGVNFSRGDGPFSCATEFPEPIGMGASFDRELVHEMGQVVSTEARAYNNAHRAGLDFWSAQ